MQWVTIDIPEEILFEVMLLAHLKGYKINFTIEDKE